MILRARLWLRAGALALGRPPLAALLVVSLGAWWLLAVRGATSPEAGPFCGRQGLGRLDGFASSIGHWALMLLAMMPLLLAQPIRVVLRGSLPRQRTKTIAVFVAGYGLVWTAAGALLMPLAAHARTLFEGAALDSLLPMAIVAAVLWHLSPLGRICLGRCHFVPTLRIFGLGAVLDSAAYGITSGLWCLGTCWLWMLVPLVIDRGHLLAMAAITALVTTERHFGGVESEAIDPRRLRTQVAV